MTTQDNKSTERCLVDHEERKAMGLLGCYICGAALQSREDANKIRAALGKYLYDPPGYKLSAVTRAMTVIEANIDSAEVKAWVVSLHADLEVKLAAALTAKQEAEADAERINVLLNTDARLTHLAAFPHVHRSELEQAKLDWLDAHAARVQEGR